MGSMMEPVFPSRDAGTSAQGCSTDSATRSSTSIMIDAMCLSFLCAEREITGERHTVLNLGGIESASGKRKQSGCMMESKPKQHRLVGRKHELAFKKMWKGEKKSASRPRAERKKPGNWIGSAARSIRSMCSKHFRPWNLLLLICSACRKLSPILNGNVPCKRCPFVSRERRLTLEKSAFYGLSRVH